MKGRVGSSRFVEGNFLGRAGLRDKRAGGCAPDAVAIAEKEIIVSEYLRVRGSNNMGLDRETS